MPRGPRLDAPGVLHHVMARGIERQTIFHDNADREDLLERVSKLVHDRQLSIYAWALMPNHFHLLVRTGGLPLERSMRSLLTGFATVFNRRHDRVGHLFQNRYKSVVCEAERYFLELVRYIHLNPLRAGIVRHVDELDDYPYTGHSALLSTVPRTWQSTGEVLGRFGRDFGWARAAYRKFVCDGAMLGKQRELAGGGLVRCAGGWKAVSELRRGREEFTADERVLGSSQFVDQILSEVARRKDSEAPTPHDLCSVKEIVCAACGVSPRAVCGRGRIRRISEAREGLAYLWVEFLGRSGGELALDLGLRPESVYKAAKRGREKRDRWIRLLDFDRVEKV
ncbi:MAG TPA: transposase [Candidatus Binatia bacterium]|nr:transposase [Candidatus Binatia bacterium]